MFQTRDRPDDRRAVFSVYCEAESGERFIVAMQKAKQKWFKDRALFCVFFPILDQAPRVQWLGVKSQFDYWGLKNLGDK